MGPELLDANPAGNTAWMSRLCVPIPVLCWHLEPAQLLGVPWAWGALGSSGELWGALGGSGGACAGVRRAGELWGRAVSHGAVFLLQPRQRLRIGTAAPPEEPPCAGAASAPPGPRRGQQVRAGGWGLHLGLVPAGSCSAPGQIPDFFLSGNGGKTGRQRWR